MPQRLDYDDTIELLEDLLEEEADVRAEGHEISWTSDEGSAGSLKLSLLFPSIDDEFEDYVRSLETDMPSYAVILMRAGSASLGFYERGELRAHKVIRKYMVRMKQGKAQLTHMKTKGKSRAGSRIRLRESLEFFEEINEKLREWFEGFGDPQLIFYSMPVTFKSLWFGSDVAPPFSPDDKRLTHIPIHVHQPDHEELGRVARLLATSVLEEEG